jgi:hypothetical protein
MELPCNIYIFANRKNPNQSFVFRGKFAKWQKTFLEKEYFVVNSLFSEKIGQKATRLERVLPHFCLLTTISIDS